MRSRTKVAAGALRVLALAVLAAFTGGCATTGMPDASGPVGAQIARQEARVAAAPDDVDALRDLGILHLHAGDLPAASRRLQEAASRRAADPATLFYLGLAYEQLGQPDEALLLYGRYEGVARTSPYRGRLRARYEQLTRERARTAVRALLAQERALTGELAADHRVAVFPLDYVGSVSRYEPLGRGLAELVTVDLAGVAALSVVERVQLQALLDELALGETGYVDPATAPRLGRLLGAGRIVAGTYDVLSGGQDVRLDALLAARDGAVTPVSAPGDLRALFDVQKALVFGLLDALGVEPTPAERARIQTVPTQNLQAFLLYSRGLQAEDAGRWAAAAALHGEAAALDPAFGLATERAEAAAGAAEVGGTPEEALAAAALADGIVQPALDPLSLRLQQLNASLGAHLLPGPGARSPAQEGAGPLPEPPPPGNR